MKGNTTSWVVAGLGIVATAIGSRLVKGRFGAGVTGFGMAHLLLGALDMFRPSINKS
ncbi:MAG: hypothetical protein GX039_00190 [Clostridia bacterium]|nr:hypothetical protein [Clostridia bacterium]